MIYFRVFDHTSSYTEYMASEDAVIPSVSYCYGDNKTYIASTPPSIQYRWVDIDLSIDYECDTQTYTKYYKQKRQRSEDGGTTWVDVEPAETRRGASAETLSEDCGYIPPQYQWVNIDPNVDYYCNSETHTKYYKQQQQVSYDGGTTWQNVTPAVYQQGGVAAINSTDCGYVPATLRIDGPSTVSAETCEYKAIGSNVSDVTTAATWSITAGSQYATIDSTNGQVTILAGANESSVTIQAVYDALTATTTVALTYLSGSMSETTTDIVVDESGNTTTVVTIVTENEDGSSTETTEAVITDESGNTIGSTESTIDTNADGSYSGSTTNYDANGDPVDGSNVNGDTQGNVSTQELEYDASGNSIVVGYDIDTSGSEDGEKTFNGDGVNTEYYAFDVTRGFVLDFNFTINFNQQPAGQNENHHNILTAKRATPSPWYGFQLRQTGTNKVVILGTQFASGSNTNTNLTSAATATANTAEYNLTITYNPTASTRCFVCHDNIHNTDAFTSNLKFPDIEELKYLKVVIGYAMDENGDPYRYSNINVKNFNLRKT